MTTILLSTIASVERFQADIAAGRIWERQHPDDSELRIYSYSKMTQYGGLWTPESKLARGLILRVPGGDFEKATVESRGLPKFFTVAQSQDDWGRVKLIDDDENVVVDEAPEIPWDLPAIVANKLNGALGLGYIDPSGRFRISTKGSFGSLEAEVANRVLDSKYVSATDFFSRAGSAHPALSTMLFEIITPERPHPVDYGDLEDLILLGTIDNATGAWTPAQGDEDAVLMGFPYAETHKVRSLRDAVELPYEDNTEGFVVTVIGAGPEAIYKVKPNEYLQLRKLFYSLQDSVLKDFVSTRAFMDQLFEINGPDNIDLSALVGELKLNGQMEAMLEKRRSMIYTDVALPAQALIGRVADELDSWGAEKLDGRTDWAQEIPRGDVARWIKGKPKELQGLFFSVYSSIFDGQTSKAAQAAVKNVLESAG